MARIEEVEKRIQDDTIANYLRARRLGEDDFEAQRIAYGWRGTAEYRPGLLFDESEESFPSGNGSVESGPHDAKSVSWWYSSYTKEH
jgi:hypothetical protein